MREHGGAESEVLRIKLVDDLATSVVGIGLEEVSLGADVSGGEGQVIGKGLLETKAPIEELRCPIAVVRVAVGDGLRGVAAGVVAGAVGGVKERRCV